MLFQIALKLHKIIDEINKNCTFEHVTVSTNIICTSRQTSFKILRTNNGKIGMNSTSNKLYHLNKLIGHNTLSLTFVRCKKLMKIQFLKYGTTWNSLIPCNELFSGKWLKIFRIVPLLRVIIYEIPGVMEYSGLCKCMFRSFWIYVTQSPCEICLNVSRIGPS